MKLHIKIYFFLRSFFKQYVTSLLYNLPSNIYIFILFLRETFNLPVRGTPRRIGKASAACTSAQERAKCLALNLSRANIFKE